MVCWCVMWWYVVACGGTVWRDGLLVWCVVVWCGVWWYGVARGGMVWRDGLLVWFAGVACCLRLSSQVNSARQSSQRGAFASAVQVDKRLAAMSNTPDHEQHIRSARPASTPRGYSHHSKGLTAAGRHIGAGLAVVGLDRVTRTWA
jgi:hypothetical protein